MSQLKKDFKEVFSKPKYLISFIVLFVLIKWLFNYFTNDGLIKGNLGHTYYFAEIIALTLIALLFSSFVVLSMYKINYFRQFSTKEASVGGLGTILGVLVVGCPACSITLASYVGLAGFFAGLPLFGLEVKLVSIPLLLYANYSVLTSLKTCRLKSKKKN